MALLCCIAGLGASVKAQALLKSLTGRQADRQVPVVTYRHAGILGMQAGFQAGRCS